MPPDNSPLLVSCSGLPASYEGIEVRRNSPEGSIYFIFVPLVVAAGHVRPVNTMHSMIINAIKSSYGSVIMD